MKPAEKILLVRIAIGETGILGISQWIEWMDRSWGALAAAIMINPVCNLILMVVGLVIVAGRKRDGQVRAKVGYPIVLLVPLIGTVVNFLSLGLMGLHGC